LCRSGGRRVLRCEGFGRKDFCTVASHAHGLLAQPCSLVLKLPIAALGPGDTLIVTRLDTLARSTRDLLNTLDRIGKVGAGFRSLADIWADTTTPHGRLMVTVLAGLAEFERALILARTGEGRQRAIARGVRFGRKPKLTAHQTAEAIERRKSGETLTDIARSYNVSHSTISRL